MKNKWMIAFFSLLGVVLLGITILAILITRPIDSEVKTKQTNDEPRDAVPFLIKSNKEDLNRIIEHYIEEEGIKGPVDYRVVLDDTVNLYGSVPVFTKKIEFKLTFEPKALDNGDLLLKQKSISVGELNLPVSYILNVIKDSYDFPEWVRIAPSEEMIYLSLQNMKLKSDFTIKAETFNLKNDDISFKLLLPVD